MRSQTMLAIMAAAPAAMAHCIMSTCSVDGEYLGDGVGIRLRETDARYPLTDLTSDDMACNVGGDVGADRVIVVPDGAVIACEWRSRIAWVEGDNTLLASNHRGSCSAYLKKVDSAIDAPGSGDGWWKFSEQLGSDSDGLFCTDRIIANNGMFAVPLPEGIEGGYYLLRMEINGLHHCKAEGGIPNVFTSCLQIWIDSDGDLVPETTFGIPSDEWALIDDDGATVHYDDIDLSDPPNILGPRPAHLVHGGNFNANAGGVTEGQLEDDVVFDVGGFHRVATEAYSDKAECLVQFNLCRDDYDVCKDTVVFAAQTCCSYWRDRCWEIRADCLAEVAGIDRLAVFAHERGYEPPAPFGEELGDVYCTREDDETTAASTSGDVQINSLGSEGGNTTEINDRGSGRGNTAETNNLGSDRGNATETNNLGSDRGNATEINDQCADRCNATESNGGVKSVVTDGDVDTEVPEVEVLVDDEEEESSCSEKRHTPRHSHHRSHGRRSFSHHAKKFHS